MKEQISLHKGYICQYVVKDVPPTSEARQKMFNFYHDKKIHIFKFGVALPNPDNVCLLRSTIQEFYAFDEEDEDLQQKIQANMMDGLLLCSYVKQVLTSLSPGKRPICAIKMLALIKFTCIPTHCVNLCQQAFTRVEILIRRQPVFL